MIDFGQNLVGWVIVKANGNAGDKITIRHAEVLDKDGNFYTENLRAAKATRYLYIYQVKVKNYLNLILLFMDFGI